MNVFFGLHASQLGPVFTLCCADTLVYCKGFFGIYSKLGSVFHHKAPIKNKEGLSGTGGFQASLLWSVPTLGLKITPGLSRSVALIQGYCLKFLSFLLCSQTWVYVYPAEHNDPFHSTKTEASSSLIITVMYSCIVYMQHLTIPRSL